MADEKPSEMELFYHFLGQRLETLAFKLTAMFAGLAIAPLCITVAVIHWRASSSLSAVSELAESALEAQVLERFVAVNDLKRNAVESYYQTVHDQVSSLAQDPRIMDYILTLEHRLQQAYHC